MSVAAPSAAPKRAELLAAAPPAVTVEHVSKTFRIPHQRYHTLKERALHPLRARTFDALHAVHDASFEVAQGEFFGIVGRNGSGKSTLLKCLAGIYQTDSGRVAVAGRLSPFIELGVGFNPDLTARDNVLINGVMLGLSRREARQRFEEIVAFAELEDFLDLKLKNYSSGMSVRLAFSVAIQVDADVILVDEVLAVGDAAFQQKCFDQFYRLKDAGKTIIFVSHDMGAVERFCDRALLIERGDVVSIGDPVTIGRQYMELNFGRLAQADAAGGRYGDRAGAEITRAWFEDGDGEQTTALAQGEWLHLAMEVRFRERLQDPIFSFTLRNDARATIFVASSGRAPQKTGVFEAGETAVVRVRVQNWFAPSRYTLSPAVARAGGGDDLLDLREDVVALIAHASHATGGVVDPPHEWEVSRA